MKIVQLSSLFSWKELIRDFCRMVWFLSLVLLVTACVGNNDGRSSRESAGSDTTVPDTCTLLSDADVETVLGNSVSAVGEVAEDGLFSTCTWIDGTSGARLSLNIWGGGNAEDGWATEWVSAQAGAEYNETVENLGEEAYANIDGDRENYIWRKDNAFVVIFTSAVKEASEDVILELARKIDNGF